ARPQFQQYEWAARAAQRNLLLDLYVKSLPKSEQMEILQIAAAEHLREGNRHLPLSNFVRYAAWASLGKDDRESEAEFRKWEDAFLSKGYPPHWIAPLVMRAYQDLRAGDAASAYGVLAYLAWRLEPVYKVLIRE